MTNPYDWTLSRAAVPVHRAILDEVAAAIRGDDDSRLVVLGGGRGMGKTWLLNELHSQLARDPANEVVLLEGPPVERHAPAAVSNLGQRLKVQGVADGYAKNELVGLVARWMEEHPNRQLFLLFDEVDTYVGREEARWARDFFNGLRAAHEKFADRMGLVLAGGLGVFLLEPELGSPLLSRAATMTLSPFDELEAVQLMEPFRERGTPIDDETRSALRQLSGGNPALLTYGLHRLWKATTSTPRQVFLEYDRFQARNEPFLESVRRSVGIGEPDSATERLWRYIERTNGPYPLIELEKELTPTSQGGAAWSLDRALKLLCGAGLIRLEGSRRADPVRLRAIPSILTLGPAFIAPHAPIDRCDTLREALTRDLDGVLAHLYRHGLDLFTGKSRDKLVPESTFSAIIAIGLSLRGWMVDREAQQGQGFTDIKLRHEAFPEQHAVIEVKGWWNGDRGGVHDQVLGYRLADTSALAVVMVGGPEHYSAESDYPVICLSACQWDRHDQPGASPHLKGRYSAVSMKGMHATVRVDHFLLLFARRS